jgi:long-subunit acyl-CoA synthetase (AMP-forming)
MFGFVTVPVLPSLRAEQIQHSVNQSGAKVVFCSAKSAALFAEATAKIVILDLFNTEVVPTPENCDEYLKISYLLENLLDLDQVSVIASERDASSLATIIYTSGSTGTMPKGAMFTDKIWRSLLTSDILSWGDPIVVFCKDPLVRILK